MIQSDNYKLSATGSHLKISTDKIVIDPESYTAQMVLSNLNEKFTVYFKIKTKIQKLFDVKPFIGSIKPGQQQIITFRAIKKIEASQIPNLQQNLMFLLQAVNHVNSALTKEEEQTLWKQMKAKKANIQLGYCSVKLGVTFSVDKSQQKEHFPLFNKTFQSKAESRSSSEGTKSIKPASSVTNSPNINFKQSIDREEQLLNDQELSKKYQELRQRQQLLIRQRSKLFDRAPIPKKAKGPSPLKIIIILIFTFLLGNFLWYIILPGSHQQRDVQVQNWKNWTRQWFS